MNEWVIHTPPNPLLLKPFLFLQKEKENLPMFFVIGFIYTLFFCSEMKPAFSSRSGIIESNLTILGEFCTQTMPTSFPGNPHSITRADLLRERRYSLLWVQSQNVPRNLRWLVKSLLRTTGYRLNQKNHLTWVLIEELTPTLRSNKGADRWTLKGTTPMIRWQRGEAPVNHTSKVKESP